MTAQRKPYLTEQEYMVFERDSMTKHEYYDGQIYAMAGASRIHNLIVGNTLAALHGQLRRTPCQIFPNDMRVKVQKTGLHTYPDLVILCGAPHFTDDALDTLLNPLVLIEILSPSTERYDRGLKFQHYRTIATLQAYILIAQDQQQIEQYTKQANGQWVLQEATSSEASITIAAIQSTLVLADVYEKVDIFPDNTALFRGLLPE
jgi:Uma2 family endonuclease